MESLLLSCRALSSPTTCRFIPAHSVIVQVKSAPIELTIENGNVHGGAARLTAGSLAEVSTRGMTEADHICGNEDIYYPPLAKLEHAMPAYALQNSYKGDGLDDTWSAPFRRSSFIGTFQVTPSSCEARGETRARRGGGQRHFLHGVLSSFRHRRRRGNRGPRRRSRAGSSAT
jgi:hypothetical protein